MKKSEGSGCSEGSKTTNPYDKEDEEEEVNDDGKPRNGSSSSNSTVEENDRKASSSGIRQYVRSKMPRLRWTPDLHLCFIKAIERLGGQERATPKLVLQLMNIKGLNIAHVKSHLQMHRSKKNEDPSQANHLGLMEGVNHHIYNLSQLPLLQGFNQRPTSSLSTHGNWISRPSMSGTVNDGARPRFYDSLAERVIGRNTPNWGFHIGTSTSNEKTRKTTHESQEDLQIFSDRDSCKPQFRSCLMEPNFITQLQESGREKVNFSNDIETRKMDWKTTQQERNTLKRKASDCDLDLNLSLKMPSRSRHDECHKGLEDDGVDSDLSLCLFSSPSSSKLSRLKGEDDSREPARMASTLDLTI